MGCDIHAYFETRRDGAWDPLWGWGPDPTAWWESIADHKIETGATELVLPSVEGEDHETTVARYFKSIPLDQVLNLYGQDRRLIRIFNKPDDYGKGMPYEDRFHSRDYSFFTALANVRGGGGYAPRGYPNDLSPAVYLEVSRWDGDAHSGTWFMCSEMLADPKLNRFRQVDGFIRKHIPDPDNTRVIIFFDN